MDPPMPSCPSAPANAPNPPTGELALGLSLPECAERLRREQDLHVPALITLRRWSADGVLDAARIYPPTQRAKRGRAAAPRAPRPRYDYGKVLQFVRTQQATLQRYPVTAMQPGPERQAASEGQAISGRQRTDRDLLDPASRRSEPAPVPTPATGAPAAPEAVDADKLAQACAAATAAAINEQLQPMVKAALEQLQRQLVAAMDNIEATRRTLMVKYDAELHSAKAHIAELQAQNAALRAAASPVDTARLVSLMSRVADRLART